MIRVWRTAANCGIQWCAIAGTLLWEGGCGPQIPCDLSRTQLSAGGRGHVAKGAEQAYQPAEFVRLKLGLHIAYHRLGGLVEAAQAASAEFWARHGVTASARRRLFRCAARKSADRLEAIKPSPDQPAVSSPPRREHDPAAFLGARGCAENGRGPKPDQSGCARGCRC
jgi:hypothetical protein